jgi:hypothetical protein
MFAHTIKELRSKASAGNKVRMWIPVLILVQSITVVLMNNVLDPASPVICMNIIQKSGSNSRRAKMIL